MFTWIAWPVQAWTLGETHVINDSDNSVTAGARGARATPPRRQTATPADLAHLSRNEPSPATASGSGLPGRGTRRLAARAGKSGAVLALAAIALAVLAAPASAQNHPPVFSPDAVTRAVNENTGANQNVGSPVTATDADSDALTYTLGGTDAAFFDIVSNSGQIQTKSGVTYDHEAKASYTVTVTASDGTATDEATVTITITITDVTERPAAVSDVAVVPVLRSTTSLTVSWSAPDNVGKPALTGYDVRYADDGDTNWTTVRQDDAASPSLIISGLISNGFYDFQVRAINVDGAGPWSSTAEGATSPRPETLFANNPVIPDDLEVGDSFRLLYITGTADNVLGLMPLRAATGTGIHDYHDFVLDPVLHIVEPGNFLNLWGETSLRQVALLSLPGADARLLTDTTWTETDLGVPIYWFNGARVADDYADFYDGTWADEANPVDGLGQPYPLDGPAPWTGTDHDGTELFDGNASRAVGQATVGVGGLGSSAVGAGPLNGRVAFASTEERPLYGLWHVMVVGENLRLIDNIRVQRRRTEEGADERAAVRAQLFTTGPHSSGYGIVEIEVHGTDDDDFLGDVALYTTDANGKPDLVDGLHATLILENNYGSPWRLKAPEGTVLKPSTTYALVFQGESGSYPDLCAIGSVWLRRWWTPKSQRETETMENEPAPPVPSTTGNVAAGDEASSTTVQTSESASPRDHLKPVQQCLSELRDLFEQQIARNKNHHEAFDKLYREMEGYKESFLLDAIQKPMVYNLIRLYDSFLRLEFELQSLCGPETGHQLSQFRKNMENFRFELTEVLARMDAESYEDHLDVSAQERLRTLDRKLHKPVEVEPTRDPRQDNMIASVHKHGFYWRGKVLRPEEVKVFRHTPPATHGGDQADG